MNLGFHVPFFKIGVNLCRINAMYGCDNAASVLNCLKNGVGNNLI